jgi:hypothetical protein
MENIERLFSLLEKPHSNGALELDPMWSLALIALAIVSRITGKSADIARDRSNISIRE